MSAESNKRFKRAIVLVCLIAVPILWALGTKVGASTVCEGSQPAVVGTGEGVDAVAGRHGLHGKLYDIRNAVAKLNPGVDLAHLQAHQPLTLPASCR